MHSTSRTERIFFATDIHGSEICWRKFLRSRRVLRSEDPDSGRGHDRKGPCPHRAARLGEMARGPSSAGLRTRIRIRILAIETSISSRGYYPFRTDEDGMAAFAETPDLIDRLFHRTLLEAAAKWMEIAEKKLLGSGVRCYVCPGNDDAFEIDEVIAASQTVSNAEGLCVDLGGGFTMASTGWSNPTPWKTHREAEEPALYERLSAMIPESADCSRWIFNLHAPPRATGTRRRSRAGRESQREKRGAEHCFGRKHGRPPNNRRTTAPLVPAWAYP